MLFSTWIFGQEKVIEKSAKERPGWVYSIENNFIIVSVQAPSLEEAKEKVLENILVEIVNSVALTVKSKTEMFTETITKNQILNSLEMFKNETTIESAKVPFLKGVSLSKARGYYWEKLKNKKDNTITYTYSVRYPFSNFELNQIISEYEKRDLEMNENLKLIIFGIDSVRSVENIEENIGELCYLSSFFTGKQKNLADLASRKLNNMLESIEIEPLKNNPNELSYLLKINNTTITTIEKPRIIKSDCIKIISKKTKKNIHLIEYIQNNCFADDDNFIKIIYRFGNKNISRTFYPKQENEQVEIFIKDGIEFSIVTQDEKNVMIYHCNINVISKNNNPFTVNSILIKLDKTNISFLNINKEFSGQGVHPISIADKKLLAVKVLGSGYDEKTVSGIIIYTNDINNNKKQYKFFNHKIAFIN